ncbi:MAG: A/G-specific adenine glycosylase [Actinomycetia bacterium]|nr:A/G-specific adenine glycosylase [Actinomycetes bacterium]
MKRIKYEAVVDPGRLGTFRRTILTWFREEGRSLPWRETRDPYAVLVAEILLHQTTVQTVIPVYRRFLEAFPDIRALAAAPLEAVKAITDPLGYKVRGKWLKAIAETVVERFDGSLPDTLEGLMSLPGVGRYTAGACLAFAFERPAGVLDTNVTRVLARYFGLGPPRTADDRHRLWALAETVVPPEAPWAFNQGLMDFGAVVCRARKPLCLTCPLAETCPSRGVAAGLAASSGEPRGVWFWERPRRGRAGGGRDAWMATASEEEGA